MCLMLQVRNFLEANMKYLIFTLLLAACSPNTDPTPKVAENPREALEKARAIESALQEAAENSKRQMDEQSE